MHRRARFAIFAVAVLIAACPSPVPYVAVPEARFRSEDTRQKRLQLPLDASAREKLATFLEAGGDTDNVGSNVVDPAARSRYAPLLDRLSDPRFLAFEDLTERSSYDAWFTGRRLRQVVDAREKAPAVVDPVAASDGHYWWIFYSRHKRLAELLVVRAIPVDSPK